MSLMLFDLESTGHHANYIRYILNYWIRTDQADELVVVVSPDFVEKHKNIVSLASREHVKSNIKFIAISSEEANSLFGMNRLQRLIRRLREWQLLCKYAELSGATQCLIMFVDKLQLPITLGLRPPCPCSGIYFQPSFHYSKFSQVARSNHQMHDTSIRAFLKTIKDVVFLRKVNRSNIYKNIFTLDFYAAQEIKKEFRDVKCVYLPDPIEAINPSDWSGLVKEQDLLNPSERTTFIIFGYLDGRKGINKILDALELLPVNTCEQIKILLIGQLDQSLESSLPRRLAQISKSKSVLFLTDFNYVSDQQVYDYFGMSDVVLALYQNHIGMSGILLTAAAMQKPVLCQEYGLMGKLVREHELGIGIDSTQPEEIARSIEYILSVRLEGVGNKEKMRQFVELHSSDNFTKILMGSLGY